MKIGQLAKRAQVNVQTIRFYEREGLMPDPGRTTAGYRTYLPSDLERIHVIRQFQGLGFTLTNIREVFEFHRVLASTRQVGENRSTARAEMLSRARGRLGVIDEKLAVLTGMRAEMLRLIEALSGPGEPVCIARPRPDTAEVCSRA